MLSNEPSVHAANRSHENMTLTAWSQQRRRSLYTYNKYREEHCASHENDAQNIPVFAREMTHFVDVQAKSPIITVAYALSYSQ